MPSTWRRSVQFLATLALLATMLACGGSSSSSGESDPAGQLIAGTGPVNSVQEAANRLVTQFLGLSVGRQDGVVVGTGDDPTGAIYEVQSDPLPRGTTIRPFFDAGNYVLNRPYYVFFYDPNLLANFEHLAYFLYVRPTDGAIYSVAVASWPVIDGLSRLVTEAERLANLVYIHDSVQGMLDSPPTARYRQALSGAKAHGLIVASEEARRQGDIDNAASYLQELTGEANPLSVLWENHPDPFGKDDFAKKLKETSEGLGPNDKYFIFLATHGSAPPNSQIAIGDEVVDYDELCKLINDNVSAGHINIFNAACYSGNMTPVFEKWDEMTDKAVHWFTDSDATHPSYSYPDTIGLKCALMQMQEALEAARGDGAVTLAEIEQAMADLELTADEIIQKMCDIYKETHNGQEPPWKDDLKVDDPGDDQTPRPGEPGKGGFGAGEPSGEVSQRILDLLEKLRQARLADDPIQLGPLYDPNYHYDGKNHADIIRSDPNFDTTVFGLGTITVLGSGGDDLVVVDIDRTIEVHGTQPIRSEQEGTRVFRIDPIDPADILSERLAFWRQFDAGGPLGLQAPPPPPPLIQPPVVVGNPPFQVDSFFDVFYEISLNSLGGTDALPVETVITFLPNNRQFSGTQVDGVFASLGGSTVPLVRQGSTNTYAGDVPIPRQVGFWVLSISASSRIANGQTGDFVSAATGRSIEIRVVP